ncbi:MAG: hypothetical protein V9G98_18860 [Candidatus Competibacter sp.]
MAMRASGNRRLVCLLGLILLGSPMLALAALPRAASLTVCADQYLLGLADPAQIVAVSPDAADPNQSLFAAEAVRYPAHRGDSEELVALQAELVLTDRWLPLRTSERLERLGIRVIQLPLPDSWAEIAATTRTVAAALGRPAQGEARSGRDGGTAGTPGGPSPALFDRRSPLIFCPMAVALAQALLSTPCCKRPARAIWQPPWVYRVGEPSNWSSWRSPNPI